MHTNALRNVCKSVCKNCNLLIISVLCGERGIRTPETDCSVWRISSALPSTTRPSLRCKGGNI